MLATFAVVVPAAACSGTRLAGQPIDDSTAVVHFTGTAIHVDDSNRLSLDAMEEDAWTFAVDGVRKGSVGEQFTIVTPRFGASCGVEFKLGHRYQVLGSGRGWFGPPVVWMNSGTREIEALENPPPISVRTPSEGGGGMGNVWIALVVIVVLVALIAVQTLRRRRASVP